MSGQWSIHLILLAKYRRDRGCRGAIGTLICIQWPTRSTEQTFYGGFGAARNDRSYRPFAARKRAFRFVRVEQVREAGVRHGYHDDRGRLNPRSTLRPRGWNGGGSGSIGKSGKGLCPGGRGSDNGGAKSGDLQGTRRLVGSLFQRQLPLEDVSPSLTVAKKLRRHETYAETNDRRRRRI